MVRAVLTERLTSDYDVKCRITFSFSEGISSIQALIKVENQSDDFVKVMKDAYGKACFHLFLGFIFIYTTTVIWIEPQSTVEDSHQFLLAIDYYTVHPNFLYMHTRYR